MAETESILKLDNLISEVSNFASQANITTIDKLKKLTILLHDATDIVKESGSSVDVVTKDLDFVSTAANVISNEIGSAQQTVDSYDPQRFATCIKNIINTRQNWLSLFSTSMLGSSFIPISHSMFSTFNPEQPVVKERQKRQKMSQKEPVAELVCPDSIDKAEQMEETSAIVEKIKGKLTKLFADNKMQPLRYFPIVIDPHDFGKTIDNIFQISFLVRDRTVELFEDDSDLWLKMLKKSDTEDRAPGDGKQVVMSMDMTQWMHLTKKYNIKKAKIDISDRYAGKTQS